MEASTTSKSTNLMSSCQLDVDHLVEKVDKCPGSLSIFCIQLGPRKVSIIWSSGVSAFQGLLEY